MSKYIVNAKHKIGKKVYILDRDTFDQKKPKILVGNVIQIEAVLEAVESKEPIVQYYVRIADTYRDEKKYFDFQLLTKSEAERRYQAYCNDLKTFDDIYLKTMLKKAQELVNAYKDKQ